MAPKSLHILLAVISLLAISAASTAKPYAREIVEIAKFAVAEHNKDKNTSSLVFVSVVEGEKQVVAGMNYRLVISAEDGAAAAAPTKTYTAVVYSNIASKSLELTSFEQIKG
ncbi:hypothetical protein OROHE_024444 [Orobanche hederae]